MTASEVQLVNLASAPGALLQGGTDIRFDIAPDVRLDATPRFVKSRAGAVISWSGVLRGKSHGSLDLVLTPQGLSGMVRIGSELFAVEPLGERLHAVTRIDRAKMPLEHPPAQAVGALSTNSSAQADALSEGASSMAAVDNGDPYLDVLVVYTPAAAAAYADMAGLAQRGVDEANQAYYNSAAFMTQRLKAVVQTNFNESGLDYTTIVNRLQDPNDGYMDEVHTLRGQYLADLVVLVVDNPQYCGLASQIQATFSTAFAAVNWGCIWNGNFSMTHEIGHLQGARHDRATDPTATPFANGHGYIDPNHQWRTIMAYPDPCGGCVRVQYWSNPDVSYPPTGQPMGTTTYENNARVLLDTKFNVRDFLTLPTPTNFRQVSPMETGAYPRLGWNAVGGATSYSVYRCITTSSYPPSSNDSCFYSVYGQFAVTGATFEWYDPFNRLASGYPYCSVHKGMYYVRAYSPEGLTPPTPQVGTCLQ